MNRESKIDTTPKKDYDLAQLIPKADAGDLQAQYDVLMAAMQAEDDVEQAIKAKLPGYTQSLMDAEEPSGCFYLAQLYENGDGVERDVQKAARLYISSGDRGAAFGYEYAGLLYYYGDGIEQDHAKAFELISKGDRKSLQPEPLFALAEMLRQGLGTQQDAEQANTLYWAFLAQYNELANRHLEISRKMAFDLLRLCVRVRMRLAEAFETGLGGLEQNHEEAEDMIRSAVRMLTFEKADDRKYGITTQEIYEAFSRITGIPMEDKPFLTDLKFNEYLDFEDGRIASMKTMGDSELEIPVNVFAEPGSDLSLPEGAVCPVELFSSDFEVDTYDSAEDVKESTNMAPIAMIPIGTFPLEADDPSFRQSPWIIFNGKVIHLALRRCHDSDPADNDYALCVTVETADLLVTLEVQCEAEVELGEYWHGTAFLSAVIRKEQ